MTPSPDILDQIQQRLALPYRTADAAYGGIQQNQADMALLRQAAAEIAQLRAQIAQQGKPS